MQVNPKNIVLIEDHDEALRVWRERNIKNLDLVHIDAHIDFRVYQVRPIEKVVNQARSLKELKKGLECSLAFKYYENDFAKQTYIGNYIYPAMQEGIIKDFYWVIPGRLKDCKKSFKLVRGMLKSFSKQGLCQSRHTLNDGIISTNLLGRKFVICILEKLPSLKQRTLLDIDTDFLVIDSLLNVNSTAEIGKRKRWIRPDRLVKELRKRVFNPAFTTIAYSVNGGYAPMRYKVLADELAYRLSPCRFKQHFAERLMSSTFFNLFESTGNKEYYQKAIKLNPAYRAADNNYGPLYLDIRRFAKAEKEFLKVAKVDPGNPAALMGLGKIALERKDFKKAKKYFSVSLKGENSKLFEGVKTQGLLGLAQAEFRLKNFKKAKELFLCYQKNEPLQPQSRYILGRIYEKEKNFEKAVAHYQDALRLGLNNTEVISGLLRTACHLNVKHGIIKYITAKYREFKKGFLRRKRLSLKKGKRINGFKKIEKKMAILERRLLIS